MSIGCGLFADQNGAADADFSIAELVDAYIDCRRTKRNSPTARAWELNLEANLIRLDERLRDRSYRPGPSTCFVIRRPKPREVWAAQFEDRVAHHLLYNRIVRRFHHSFIADTCACIPGRGTMYAAERLDRKIRSITQNWSRPAFYLKCDLANFFVSIDKHVLRRLLVNKVREPWWLWLLDVILFHDPRIDVQIKARPRELKLIPPHKSLFNQPEHLGLPIGNLSSQFFANVYLDALDQHVKHRLHARHYVRYVDDFVLLHQSAQQLNAWLTDIAAFLPRVLNVHLNPTKTILQPVDRGVDIVGQIIKPWCRRTRRRTCREALSRTAAIDRAELFQTANSYLGLLGQAPQSHHDRARLANILRYRGCTVDASFTKTYRGAW